MNYGSNVPSLGQARKIRNYVRNTSTGRRLRLAVRSTDAYPHRVNKRFDLVLITGGGDGLGKQLAFEFNRRGYATVVLDINIPIEKEQVSGVHYYRCDITNSDEVTMVVSEVRRTHGTPTILVNNAAVACSAGSTVNDMSMADIARTVDVNLMGTILVTKTVLPLMLARHRGYIVTISSVLAYLSPAKLAAYGASKAALLGFHESLSYELGPPSSPETNIHTLLVSPGQLQTRLFNNVQSPSQIFAPVIDPYRAAVIVVSAVERGRVGELRFPFYARFIPIMRALRWEFQEVLRAMVQFDDAVPPLVY